MKYQLLVSTVNQKDASLINKMHINSNAIIINQSTENKFEKVVIKDKNIDIYTLNERGVGLSRNSALMRSKAEIIEFADDDMIFVDGYEEKVISEFNLHKEADAILFAIKSLNPNRPLHKIFKFKRIGIIEARKYGCARLAVRREKLMYNNITFSLLFGGGAKYGAGEDTLLINSLIRSGLKVYASPVKIADVKQESSTWFDEYNDKYYFDKGALMCAMYPYLCEVAAIILAAKHSKMNLNMFRRLLSLYRNGIADYREKM